MELYTNTRLRTKKNAVIHLRRRLPQAKGKIYVSAGQEVTPEDLLGEGIQAAGFRTVHLSRELGTSPQKAFLYLKRKIGQTIYQGELLAAKEQLFGLNKKLLLSPVDGVLDFYDPQSGNLKIKHLPKKVPLVSGVYGIVDMVNAASGTILLRTQANLIYGIFGSGREREGLLRVLGTADMLVGAKQIEKFGKGQIIVGGGTLLVDALEKALNRQIPALISGGIDEADYKTIVGENCGLTCRRWSDVGLTVLICEGFGSVPVGEDIFATLKNHDRKFALIDGNRARVVLPSEDPDSMIYIRKTKLPMRAVESEPEVETALIKVGMKVRVVAAPFLGRQGLIEAIDRSETKLASGITTFMITVLTAKTKLRVPYNNVEVIGE